MEFTNTRIYSRSLELACVCRETLASFPTGYAFLADQLRRSSSSMVLNFAEGYGKRTRKDARRYFDSARGSVNEIAATFDWAHTFGLVDPETKDQAHELADHIARMLTRFRR